MNSSFYERCRSFWQWFEKNEATLSDMCENREKYGQKEVTGFIAEGLERVGGLCFNIGGDHEFTLAVNGNRALFYLLPYLTAGMPEKYRDKWTFFPYMQPGDVSNFAFHMSGKELTMADILLDCKYEEDYECFSLAFYHEALLDLPENDRYNLFFTALDLCLGEALSLKYIGEVKQASAPVSGMVPLGSLREYMEETLKNQGKELKLHPGRTYSSYSFKPQEDENLRYDVIAGMTACMELIQDYYGGEYRTADTMEEFGAKATFLWFQYGEEDDRSEILNLRYEMEESLDKEVFGACEREDGEMPESIYEGNETGRVLGGAMGAERVYLDVLIFDEEQFDHKIKDWAGKYPYTIYKSEFKQGAESERVL